MRERILDFWCVWFQRQGPLFIGNKYELWVKKSYQLELSSSSRLCLLKGEVSLKVMVPMVNDKNIWIMLFGLV